MGGWDDSGMENPSERRDKASARIRRLTIAAVAGATALTAAFAGLAAGSTHTTKKVVKRVTRTAQAPVTAPTPKLVPSGSTVTPAAPQSQSQAPVVTPSVSPPVVVGGGS
jgi:hypothetical protein